MALRVALEVALQHFAEPDACGSDETGQQLRRGYTEALVDIRRLIHAAILLRGALVLEGP